MKRWRPLKLEELSADTQKVYDVLNKESDLACVLIGTSYLSELLASTIKASFMKRVYQKKSLIRNVGQLEGLPLEQIWHTPLIAFVTEGTSKYGRSVNLDDGFEPIPETQKFAPVPNFPRCESGLTSQTIKT
jgi:hypothetical protein